MISQELDKNLTDIYFIIRIVPAWLAWCKDAGYSQEELDHLEKLDDEFGSYQPEKEASKWAEGIERQGGADIYFSDSDSEKISFISKQIAEFYSEMEKIMSGSWSYIQVGINRDKIKKLEKLRNGFRGRQLHTEGKSFGSDKITDQDIEKARAYPLENIIPESDLNKFGYMVCQWHPDKKPSMLVKNGFGYCFSCNKSIDSIGWLIDVEKMNFVDAVKYLCGRIP